MSRAGTLDLLQEVEETVEILKDTQQIKPVKIKSILENLRSALEYVANDSYEKHTTNQSTPRPNIYFPYGEKKFLDAFFIKKLNCQQPESSPLYAVFVSIQDYQTGNNWLGMMCSLTNEVKHRQPIPLSEDSIVQGIDVNINGFGLIKADATSKIIFRDNFTNGQRIEDFTIENGKVEKSGNGIPININITEEKKIRFHGTDYEVIPFVELCLKEIRVFVNEAYEILDAIE